MTFITNTTCFDDERFIILGLANNQQEAVSLCLENEATLAAIRSLEEMNLIRSTLDAEIGEDVLRNSLRENGGFYIGLDSIGVDRSVTLRDPSVFGYTSNKSDTVGLEIYQTISEFPWRAGQPGDGLDGDECVTLRYNINTNGLLFDEQCSQTYNFICRQSCLLKNEDDLAVNSPPNQNELKNYIIYGMVVIILVILGLIILDCKLKSKLRRLENLKIFSF